MLRLPRHYFAGDVEEEEHQVQSSDPDWVLCVPVREATDAGFLL